MKVLTAFIIFSGLFFANNAFASPSEDIAGMMQTFQTNLGPVYNLVVAVSYVMGVWFITQAVFKLKKVGESRTMMSTQASMAKPIILMALGLSLLYFPTFVNTSIQSLWLYGQSSSLLRYPVEPTSWDAFIHPLIDTIRLFGLIAIVRGIVILTRLSGESPQPGSMGKGFMHIAAGTLGVNIIGTIDVIRATFGFS